MKNGIGMEFVWVPGGTFRMGHPRQRKPVHPVRVSGFWMSRYEVTNAQYDHFRKQSRVATSPDDGHPVSYVTKPDAEAFARWLSEKEGRLYRLPTDAEWEYAARGGLDQKDYPWGDEDPEGRATVGGRRATRVGVYKPNGYGLYDMAGNVSEYVQDATDGELGFPPGLDPTKTEVDPCYRVGNLWIARGGAFVGWEASVFMAQPVPPDATSRECEGLGIRLVLQGHSETTDARHP